MSPPDVPSIFSPPRSDAPWWVLPILTFVCGAALTAMLLVPVIATPDYQRGHAAGYNEGLQDGLARMKNACEILIAENSSLRADLRNR